MMINNYNCVKEYDVTYDNIREIKFYLRPWNGFTTSDAGPSGVPQVDFICELELLLVSKDY
jgi:hypothetical protein